MKHCLKKASFNSEEELILNIHVVSMGIASPILLAALKDWMEILI
jgi:hypothetical protein